MLIHFLNLQKNMILNLIMITFHGIIMMESDTCEYIKRQKQNEMNDNEKNENEEEDIFIRW